MNTLREAAQQALGSAALCEHGNPHYCGFCATNAERKAGRVCVHGTAWYCGFCWPVAAPPQQTEQERGMAQPSERTNGQQTARRIT